MRRAQPDPELAAKLVEKFSADSATAARDADALADQLVEFGLAHPVG